MKQSVLARRSLCLIVFLCTWVLLCHAQQPASIAAVNSGVGRCSTGVWRGTLGQTPVAFTFEDTWGAYHYRSGLSDLLLKIDEASPHEWQEYDHRGKATGKLNIKCDGSRLTGTWRTMDGTRIEQVAASKSPDDYDGKRVASAAFVNEKRVQFGNRSVDMVRIGKVTSIYGFQIVSPTPSEILVNRKVRDSMNASVQSHLECLRSGYSAGRFEDNPYEHAMTMKVNFWNQDALSVAIDYGGYCGGAHGYFDSHDVLYDLKIGEVVKLELLIAQQFLTNPQQSKSVPLANPLGKVIWNKALKSKSRIERSKKSVQDTDCLEMLNDQSATISRVSTTGIGFRFWYPYAVSGCIEDYIIPWKQLERFLSPVGQRYSEMIQASGNRQ
jgi:hypothetical protein